MPSRIRLGRAKGWRMPPGAVKVDRSTPWGNPFVVALDGTAGECVVLHSKLLRGFACLSCRAPLDIQKAHRQYVCDHIEDLRGRDLACWCRLDAPCHADTLLALANA